MSITITTDVFCDACPDWVHGATGPRPERAKARKAARSQGWESTPGRDLCPDCRNRDKGHYD